MSEQQDINPELKAELEAELKASGFSNSRFNPNKDTWYRSLEPGRSVEEATVCDEVRVLSDEWAVVRLTIAPEDLPALLRYKDTTTELTALKAKRVGGGTA